MSSASLIQPEPHLSDRLTSFGKTILNNQYLLEGEVPHDMFQRVACSYGDSPEHSQRIYTYMTSLWFMPATPILSNGGTQRGLPISCFLNETRDSLTGIADLWYENIFLASCGGGVGSYWGNLRSLGERIGHGETKKGKTVGIIPFIKVMDSMTLAVSQGSLRRGSAAVYIDIGHPEIEEFIELRKPSGGDHNRKSLNLHHGVVIPDIFMEAVSQDLPWPLTSPMTDKIIRHVSARGLWSKLLSTRVETGEPYMLFVDTINRTRPELQKKIGLKIKTSNLCTEITLPTGSDPWGKQRTAVCCLASLNLEYFKDWVHAERFIEDVLRFLDNVLDDFIRRAPDKLSQAVYSAQRERSVGLGVMGFHSFLQRFQIPFESVAATSWNQKMFKHIHKHAQEASTLLAHEKGPCPDAQEAGIQERFSNKLAIAPTASISTICGGTSPGIEPFVSNAFTHKTLSGSFPVRNKYLEKLLQGKGLNTPQFWSSIIQREGSIQHLDELNEDEKSVFKTAFEINQLWLIQHAADRQPYICQAQSLNLFLPSTVSKRELHLLHYSAWKKGLKSLYYVRSRSIQRAETGWVAQNVTAASSPTHHDAVPLPMNYEECVSCQ